MNLNTHNFSRKKSVWFIVVLVFIIYGNSINNEYSLDDNIVVDGIEKVAKGFSGIPEIFTTRYSIDKKQSYDYRPIVLTTFAIEKQFFSKLPVKQTILEKKKKDKLTQANISHFINVLLYALLCILIFYLLLEILPSYNILFPFIITVIFLLHPIHTEVVCNLKNRDEILMLIGMVSSILNFIKFSKEIRYKYLVFAVLFALFALLSKTNAMALVVLAPMFLYFIKSKPKLIITTYLVMILVYLVVGQLQNWLLPEVQVRIFEYFENPLMFEDWSIKRISASLYFSWFYLEMLLFPKNLSVYYGYNQIPIADWSYWQVWASLIFYTTVGSYGLYYFIKRKIIGLAIVLWFGLLIGVNNIMFLLPGIVADRFAFTFSLGYSIVLMWLLARFFKVDFENSSTKLHLPNGFVFSILLVFTVYSARTIVRNPNWHDYLTLFNHDIEHLSESAKVHALISNTMYPIVAKEAHQNPGVNVQNDVQKIIYHYKEAIRIDSNYLTCINNLGSVYVNFLGDYNSAIKYCEKAISLDSNYLEAQFNLAFSYQNIFVYEKALLHYSKVIELNPDYIKVYDLLNQLLKKHNKVEEGLIKLEQLAVTSKNPKNIYVNLANLTSLEANGDYSKSIEYFEKAYACDKTDKILCNHIIKLCQLSGDVEKYNKYLAYCQ